MERIEDKNGDVIVSASKALKIKGWDKLVEAFDKNEPIMGKITNKCKGGVIVEHMTQDLLCFVWFSDFRQTTKRYISPN